MKSETETKLKKLVGEGNYLDSPEDKMVYSYDGTPLISQQPNAILRPRSTEEVSEILKMANDDGFSVVPREAEPDSVVDRYRLVTPLFYFLTIGTTNP